MRNQIASHSDARSCCLPTKKEFNEHGRQQMKDVMRDERGAPKCPQGGHREA